MTWGIFAHMKSLASGLYSLQRAVAVNAQRWPCDEAVDGDGGGEARRLRIAREDGVVDAGALARLGGALAQEVDAT